MIKRKINGNRRNNSNFWYILDTFLKVGLGAFVSGYATYKISQSNNNKKIHKANIDLKLETSKEERQYFLKEIEEIKAELESYFKCVYRFAHTVHNLIKDHSGKVYKEIKNQNIDSIINYKKQHDIFNKENETIRYLSNRLKGIGLNNASNFLSSFDTVFVQIQQEITNEESRVIDRERFNVKRTIAEKYRVEFYNELSMFIKDLYKTN